MNKFVVFLVIIFIILCGITYMYNNVRANNNNTYRENMLYEKYLNKEIYGSTLVSIINRAVDSNERNEVEKDKKNFYVENNKNSIKIDIRITDNDTIYNMETFYNSSMDNFIKFYNKIKFKCIDIKYHTATGKIKYILFEQITN